MRPAVSTSWLVPAAAVAALAGILFLVFGGGETRPRGTMRVVGETSPHVASGAPAESIRMAPAGIIELVDSSNTPPTLLASLALTGNSDPVADRVKIDIPLSSPEADVPAAPESRRSEPAPEAPIDSAASPPPTGSTDPDKQPIDSETSESVASATALDVPDAGGGDQRLIPPVVLKAAWLDYPREARKRKSEGTVEVRILVDPAGSISAVEIEQGTEDESLNRAALDAARQMRFRAARQGGRPVAVWFNYQFSFRLPP